jgi:hypothetical protein
MYIIHRKLIFRQMVNLMYPVYRKLVYVNGAFFKKMVRSMPSGYGAWKYQGIPVSGGPVRDSVAEAGLSEVKGLSI